MKDDEAMTERLYLLCFTTHVLQSQKYLSVLDLIVESGTSHKSEADRAKEQETMLRRLSSAEPFERHSSLFL